MECTICKTYYIKHYEDHLLYKVVGSSSSGEIKMKQILRLKDYPGSILKIIYIKQQIKLSFIQTLFNS